MSFEILLVGSFTAEDSQLLRDIQNRLSLHTESCVSLHREEYLFKLHSAIRPSAPNAARYPMVDGAPLRARRDLIAAASGQGSGNEWALHTCQIPNRMYKKATVRSYASIPLESGDALAFASALGYSLIKKSTRKGFLFIRGHTSISLFQIVESSPLGRTELSKFEPPNSAVWKIEVLQTVYVPSHHSKNMQVPIANYIDGSVDLILTLAILMKGLVDLVPPES